MSKGRITLTIYKLHSVFRSKTDNFFSDIFKANTTYAYSACLCLPQLLVLLSC